MPNHKDNRGVILIMTMMMMSVLLSTAVGFGVFIISDIRQAAQIDNSIVAYYAAEAGLERNLFLIRKESDNVDVDSIEDLKNIQTAGSLSENNSSWSIGDSTDFESNYLRQRLYNGQSTKIYFLNRRTGGNLSDKIGVYWYKGRRVDGTASNIKLQITFTQLDPQINEDGLLVYYTDQSPDPEFSDSNVEVPVKQFFYNFLDDAITGCTDNCSGPYDYVVEFKALGSDSEDFIDNLSVVAYNESDAVEPEGITNITLKSSGLFNNSRQEIVAHIPPRDPVSGILGFVLFSEKDITKDY